MKNKIATMHTQGNWSLDKESNGQLWIVTDADKDSIVAKIEQGENPDGTYDIEPKEEANAKLIAAAPDMLEAMQLMEGHIKAYLIQFEPGKALAFRAAFVKYQKAIEKATK